MTDAARSNSPAWEVYDALRTARLNREYYATKAQAKINRNRVLEILIAIAVPTSAVAGFPAWQRGPGRGLWLAITGVAALASVAKPVLRWTEAVQSYTTTAARYRTVDFQLVQLASDIRSRMRYDSPLGIDFSS